MYSQASSILYRCTAAPLLLVALGLVLAELLIPSFGRHENMMPRANRNAAIATMRATASAQTGFVGWVGRDADMDGLGEYATLAELAGTAEIYTACGLGDGPLDLAHLPKAMGDVTATGCSPRQGYLFRVFLPGQTIDGRVPALATTHSGAFTPKGPFPDVDNSEQHWSIYGWPSEGSSARQVLFLDQRGILLESENAEMGYAGEYAAPAFDAALSSTQPGDMQSPLAINGTPSNDGRSWTVVAR